jgi:SprT protein
MTEEDLAKSLKRYLPASTENLIARWIVRNEVHFRVTQPRNSKFGDYRHPYRGNGHMITINGNLNPWAFLITTIHEFAHLLAWIKFRNNISPHGKEWKEQYKILLMPLIEKGIFPADLELAVKSYIHNPSASSCVDDKLMVALKKYNLIKLPFLKEITLGARFKFNDRIYIKGEKQRTRFHCIVDGSNEVYLISGLAEVELV